MVEKEFLITRVEDLDVDGVANLLEKWKQEEFIEFVREKKVDGKKLLNITEGIVKLWRPRVNAIKFISFIEDVKNNPQKYLNKSKKEDIGNEMDKEEVTMKNDEVTSFSTISFDNEAQVIVKELMIQDNTPKEDQYQTVNVTTKKRNEKINLSTTHTVEEILKKIVPAKSFLYRNQQLKLDKAEKPVSSYLPMNSSRKPKKFFRLSSYEYPLFDWKKFRLSKAENFNDRGYYLVKTNNSDCDSKINRNLDSRTKCRSLSTTEELDKYPDDHFYEDLNYSEADKRNEIIETNTNSTDAKPYKVKIQELFHTLKFPFFKKADEVFEGDKKLDVPKENDTDRDGHLYENSDSVANMYDSIIENKTEKEVEKVNGFEKDQEKLPVEDYLEPVQVSKEYSDVTFRQRDDSLIGFILGLFESKFGIRKETTDDLQTEEFEANPATPERPADSRGHMADRPLPVPVENEPYYMAIDRTEAENLLRGQPDGTFVLRPSSQPNHAYTLTVSCANAVHNVGVRRRPDGRLALGYARRGERSFASVTSLLRHHGRRRLILLAGGKVCGTTTLNSSPEYYQTPNNLPIERL